MVHRMPEHAPALFERVPRGLFGPLGDLYAELYWELLAELYLHEFEREPFVVVRSAQPGPTSVPPFDPEATDEATAIRTLARRLVARLENTGWMHFQYRGG